MQAIKNMNKVKNKPIPCKYTINKKIPKIIKISFNIDIQATIKLQKVRTTTSYFSYHF